MNARGVIATLPPLAEPGKVLQSGSRLLSQAANITLGVNVCPRNSTSDVAFPSTFGLCCVIMVMCAVMAVVVMKKYNFLLLYEDEGDSSGRETVVYTPITSNTCWVMYFLQVSLKHLLDSLIMGETGITKNTTAIAYSNYTDLVMHALTGLSLSWALLYQFKYRNGVENEPEGSETRTDSSVDAGQQMKKILTSAEAGLLMLATIHIIVAWWAVPNLPGDSIYAHSYWVFVAAVVIQRIPLFLIGGILIFGRGTKSHCTSPSKNARIVLGTGLLLDMPHMLPATTWTVHILKHAAEKTPCPLWLFSWYDIILLMYIGALCCFFGFLRLEV